MEITKKQRIKTLIVILIGISSWALSRSFIFKKLILIKDPPLIVSYGFNELYINKQFFIIIGIVGLFVVSWFVLSFKYIEKTMKGTGVSKGLLWGIYFYVLYSTAFLEFYSIFGGTIGQALLAGIADGGPLLLTGLLAGIMIGKKDKGRIFIDYKSLIGIMVLFLVGRITFYKTSNVTTDLLLKNTLLFIGLYGLMFGIGFLLLIRSNSTRSTIKDALIYIAILLPVSLSGNTLICFMYNFPLLPMVLLTGIDMCAIFLGCQISNIKLNKQG